MDTINDLELNDENLYPDESVLKSVLGKAYSAYLDLLMLCANHGMEYEWRYYKDGKSWLCKVQKGKKTIIWMSAWKDCMQACIYLPERQINGVLNLAISDELKDRIRNTKNVGRSKPCIFEVRTNEILAEIERVMNYKIKAK